MLGPSMTRRHLFGLAAVCLGLLVVGPARAATWKTNVNYGATTAMDLYVPDRPATSPAIVISLHYCGGNAGGAHGWFQSYADQYGFIIIAPKSAGSCFDAGLGRSGERANIVKMVEYVIAQNNADPKKVFAAGPSSGACMTQALLASYPDVFAGGSSLAGVPAGAWTGGGAYGWSAPASTTAQQWGDKVRNAFTGFTGSRPRVQFWQGMGDTNLTYSQAYPAQVAQWTNVFGVTDANATKENIRPAGAGKTWARTSYKDCTGLVVVEANSGPSNVVHDLLPEGLWQDVVRFFGLAQGGTPVGSCSGAGGARRRYGRRERRHGRRERIRWKRRSRRVGRDGRRRGNGRHGRAWWQHGRHRRHRGGRWHHRSGWRAGGWRRRRGRHLSRVAGGGGNGPAGSGGSPGNGGSNASGGRGGTTGSGASGGAVATGVAGMGGSGSGGSEMEAAAGVRWEGAQDVPASRLPRCSSPS